MTGKWERIQISNAGRPILVGLEKNIAVESNVGLYQGKFKAIGYQNGRIYLTTHRLCYVDETLPQTNSVALRLSWVKSTEYYGGFLRSSPKIILYLKSDEDGDSGTITPATNSSLSTDITWVCPICYFSNEFPKGYEHGTSPLPVCVTCGIKATDELIVKAIEQANGNIFSDSARNNSTTTTATSSTVTDNKSNITSSFDSDAFTPGGFKCPRCTFNNHPSLTHCELCGARLLSAKLPPSLARPDSPGPTKLLNSENSDDSVVKLSFRGNVDKAFYDHLKSTLKTKSWVISRSSSTADYSKTHAMSGMQSPERSLGSTPVGPGLHGLQQFGELNRQINQKVLGSALEDLNSLMAKAKEVIAVAETYAKHLEREESTNEDSSLSLASRRALRESSQALGIQTTVITKDMTQNEEIFYEETARQIAEFLESQQILAKEGAVSLVDLFAMYNRARGISLISPKDLMTACQQFEKLQLPIRLRKYKSGLIVVQEAYRTRQVEIKSILGWIRGLEPWKAAVGISIQDASVKFGWSVTVAVEQLAMAEEDGALCRDDQTSGVRYFDNKIIEYTI